MVSNNNTPKLSWEMDILYLVSQAVVHHRNVNALMNEVLDILDNEMKADRATLTLYHRDSEELVITASKGLSSSEKSRGKYKLGEGVTGQVGADKEAVLIYDVSKDESFLDRTKARRNSDNIAFICCPVVKDSALIGTISVDLEMTSQSKVDTVYQVILIISNLLAQAVSEIRSQMEERRTLQAENSRLLKELGTKFKPSSIIGNSGNMQEIYDQISRAADNGKNILINGETGTGKEIVAKAIHYNSLRQSSAFHTFNASAVPQSLMEKDLFGTEEDDHISAGLLELSSGGTFFIDNIELLTVASQNRLERFLQTERITYPSGKEVQLNVRLIVASTLTVEQLLETGISNDLLTRLNIVTIKIPPLRERKSDITLLADYFLSEFNQSYNKNIARISTPAINMMMAYHWPGNVRELKNCLERAILNTNDDVIHGYNMPPSLQTASSLDDPMGLGNDPITDLTVAMDTYEKELIIEALKRSRGNAAAAARTLNTTPRVLNYKFKKLNINLSDYKRKA